MQLREQLLHGSIVQRGPRAPQGKTSAGGVRATAGSALQPTSSSMILCFPPALSRLRSRPPRPQAALPELGRGGRHRRPPKSFLRPRGLPRPPPKPKSPPRQQLGHQGPQFQAPLRPRPQRPRTGRAGRWQRQRQHRLTPHPAALWPAPPLHSRHRNEPIIAQAACATLRSRASRQPCLPCSSRWRRARPPTVPWPPRHALSGVAPTQCAIPQRSLARTRPGRPGQRTPRANAPSPRRLPTGA
mmetsp:Transcript_66483/g.149326  ORF Transcript_66483/g.149326 Transcript_66483/m.149326 type:complete len:243 (+) Transcript_66483:197-925(+)